MQNFNILDQDRLGVYIKCMAIISYKELSQLREKHPGEKIVFCSGSFDLPHIGHVRFLEACKAMGGILLASVGKDEDIRKNKGPQRPIMSEAIRLKMIDSLKPVDYAFLTNSPGPEGSWLSPIEEIFEFIKPDLWVVNYDGGQMEARKEIAKKWDVPFTMITLERDEGSEHDGMSTSGIIKKIKELS